MSTIDPVESKNIAKEFQQYQIEKLEIPVMGGQMLQLQEN